MLSGREHYYGRWYALVTSAVAQGPVLDLGTPRPFQKEMAVLRGVAAEPYLCVDYVPGAEVHAVADGHALPFATGTLGAVLCSHLLEHVRDPPHVVGEVYRVLRPGGKAYLTFLDAWPYHARPGVYPDYHRFKRDAVDDLLDPFAAVDVVVGGGIVEAFANFAPARFRGLLQRIANAVDTRVPSTLTTCFYAVATK